MKTLKRYLFTLLIGFASVAMIAWSKGVFAQTDPATIFHILCDSFFAVGTVITCFGLLIFSTNEGTFDIIVYGVTSFWDMFRKKSVRKYETFYDYRASHAEKKLRFWFVVISGLIFVAISLIMLYFYKQYK